MNNEAGFAVDSTEPPDSPETPPTEDEGAPYRFSAKRRLDDLIFSLDRLICAEIAVLYFIDNSFICLALRAATQTAYLRRTPPPVPAAPLLYANIICLILHLYRKQPQAGEALRGYLHGGLLLDFIGQQGPTSKWQLILMDMIITCLQLVAFGLALQRKDMDKSKARDAASTQPDHDAEERGELPVAKHSEESDLIASGQAVVAEFYFADTTFYS